ncbi:MAG: dehydrogenase [halophilic archaeon J07HX64]|jgi:Dehydrogenases with different specificities (related to short-chain alcohol dehydrogenases)|nr:MAG: dehydrogenase [halophilic archaeon J07HX64]
MTDEFEVSTPELTPEDLLVLDDPRFTEESVALVTGAASGIGQATAVALAANGLTVVGADIDDDGLDRTVEFTEEFGTPGRIQPVQADLTDNTDVDAVVDAAAEEGDLRYVASIAGMQHIDTVAEFPMEKYDLLLDLMLRAPFYTAKRAIPHIQATDDGVGAIANMCSVHGHYATQAKAAYISAKHGLRGLTRSIAAEGAGDLRSFSVSVGYVLTPLMVDQIRDTAETRDISEREVIEDVMLGQARTKEMMTPADVANLFVFGLSGYANHLNGADLLFDGGYTHTYE